MSIELKQAAQRALNALDEATTYTGSPSWSPSMTDECIAAASALRAALSHQPVPGAWLRSSDLADLRTCNYRHIGADSPAIWAPNDVSTPSPDMGLIPVYAHPAPSVPADVARDAERYRWLRDERIGNCPELINLSHGRKPGLDAAIDAAILADEDSK